MQKKAPHPIRRGTSPHPTPCPGGGDVRGGGPVPRGRVTPPLLRWAELRPSPSRWGVRANPPPPHPPPSPPWRPASPGARPRPTCAPSSSSVCPSSSSSRAAAASPRGTSGRGGLGWRRCGAAAGGAWRRRWRARTRARPGRRGGRVGTGWRETRREGGDGGGVAAAPRARAASVAHGGSGGGSPTIAKECGGSA